MSAFNQERAASVVVTCNGCRSQFYQEVESNENPHPYIGASHACWFLYSQILAKEFENQDYFAIHRVTVDAYAAQHIGDQTDRRARQSANLHLIALWLFFEEKKSVTTILEFLKKATAIKRDWPVINAVKQPSWITVQDVALAQTAEQHVLVVTQWGKSVLAAYTDQHDEIIARYKAFLGEG
jgi:hypothetical protein